MQPSPYTDLDRPPLHQAALTRALVGPDTLWREVRVLTETASTNADVVAAARAGAAEGLVVVAEAQTAGRGRLGRTWSAPPRSGLTFSVLLRPLAVPPGVPVARWVWLPLLTGLAICRAVGRLAELEVRLKWPNDLLLGDRKLAGILVERADDAAAVGIGLNVTTRQAELPVATATSLVLAEAACTDRDPVLRAVLRELAGAYAAWRSVGGDPETSGLRAGYRESCATLGREVRVTLPDGGVLSGIATDVDASGRLVVEAANGPIAVGAGDVVHVR